MLKISSIELGNFRSFDSFKLDGIGRLTVLAGPNASGKTNAIEAVSLLTSMSSFRNPSPAELVGSNSDTAYARAIFEGDGRKLDIEMRIAEGRRKWLLNGKPRPVKEIRGTLPSVAFTPDDLSVMKGSDGSRRRELDNLGSQLNSNYYQISRDYDKLLRHKNKLLKDGASTLMLDSVDDVMAVVAEQYSQYREALFNRILPLQSAHYAKISSVSAGEDATVSRSENLAGKYLRSWEGEISEALKIAREEELERRRPVIGPHLDRIIYEIDGLDASVFASQGQQRSAILALKLAEVDLIDQMGDNPPVLLLDDVMSELDSDRRSSLVELVSKSTQTFVTTANLDYFDDEMLAEAQVVHLGRTL